MEILSVLIHSIDWCKMHLSAVAEFLIISDNLIAFFKLVSVAIF